VRTGTGETGCQPPAGESQTSPGVSAKQIVNVTEVKLLPGPTRRSMKSVMPGGGVGPGFDAHKVNVICPLGPIAAAVNVRPLPDTVTDGSGPAALCTVLAVQTGAPTAPGVPAPTTGPGAAGSKTIVQAPNVHGTPNGHWTLQPPQWFGSVWVLMHWP